MIRNNLNFESTSLDQASTTMFTPAEFSASINSAVLQLKSVQEAMASIACPEVFTLQANLGDLSQESIGELLDEVPSGYRKADKNTDYVYVIRLTKSSDSLIEQLAGQLEEARKLADDYCRVNHENAGTQTLYVGRSKKLRTRLQQHLGSEQHGIYAMHLLRWATVNQAEISISYMKFQDQEDLLIQAIEDGIWASLKPAFGRKGER